LDSQQQEKYREKLEGMTLKPAKDMQIDVLVNRVAVDDEETE